MDTFAVSDSQITSCVGLYIMPANGETARQTLERVTTFNPPAEYPVIDLFIPMPCGENVTYRTFDDIPEVSTPCTCGNPDHWFVKIGKDI